MLSRKAKIEMERTLTRAKFPYLIEITYYRNNNTTEVFRYANSDTDMTFENHTFSAGYFTIQRPQRTTSGFTDAKITISALDQAWIERIRNADKKKRSEIRFVAVIDYDNNGTRTIEPIEDMEFILTNATADEKAIQWSMKFDEKMEVQVPFDECNDRVCPALV